VAPIFQLIVARCAGANCLDVVLKGMGNDGAAGMLVMKEADVFNLMQDEASCLAFGIPKKRS
jgi:two-component system chemotaxis response regulator CheB